MNIISQNSAKVNLENVIPALIEQGRILAIVDVCLRKVSVLDVQQHADQIQEIYSIIEALFSAI